MRIPAALSATLAWLLVAQWCSAETPASAAPKSPSAVAPASTAGTSPALIVVPAEPDEPLLEPIADAKDRLGGHLLLGAAAGAKWAFGSHARALGTGLGLNLDFGFGISRSVTIGAWGEFDEYSAASGCSGCSGRSFAGGPFVRYHVVQGTRFDPWGSLGVGVRDSHVDLGTSSHRYWGPEIVKLSLGGDWYASSNLGFGPYVTFDVGTFDRTGHTSLGAGLRLLFNLPGR